MKVTTDIEGGVERRYISSQNSSNKTIRFGGRVQANRDYMAVDFRLLDLKCRVQHLCRTFTVT